MLTVKKRSVYTSSRLGVAIFNADITVQFVAKILEVSRPTVYKWFENNTTNISYMNGISRTAISQALEELVAENKLPCIKAASDKAKMIKARYQKIKRDLLSVNGVEESDETSDA